MKRQVSRVKLEEGFSLLELIIAMAITVTIMGVASTLLAEALHTRTRANETSDTLADVQRALNIMSREIAEAGFNLVDNGIVAGDSVTDANGNSTIRIRSNLNKFKTVNADGTPTTIAARNGIGVVGEDAGEDVKYFIYPAGTTTLLARYDAYATAGGSSTVLANRLDSLHIHYFSEKVTYNTNPALGTGRGCDITGASLAEVAPTAAKYVVIAVCVRQAATGTPGGPGYQPAANVLLVSDVALRNSNLPIY
jgi:Tfp pilus assembly protein PilW